MSELQKIAVAVGARTLAVLLALETGLSWLAKAYLKE